MIQTSSLSSTTGQRLWDPNQQYQQGFLKNYHYWSLEISYRQHTLGSFIIFSHAPLQLMSHMSSSQSRELPIVMHEIETALVENPLFAPNHFNYLQLGNQLKHLHLHGIPRYRTERVFADKTWHDHSFGSPPRWSRADEKDSVVETIATEVLLSLRM